MCLKSMLCQLTYLQMRSSVCASLCRDTHSVDRQLEMQEAQRNLATDVAGVKTRVDAIAGTYDEDLNGIRGDLSALAQQNTAIQKLCDDRVKVILHSARVSRSNP